MSIIDDTSSADVYGVVRPHPSGRWVAAHGIGSHTRDLGEYRTLDDAVAAAGADGRDVIHAHQGESAWAALARRDLEAITERTGIDTTWLIQDHGTHIGVVVDLDEVDPHADVWQTLAHAAGWRHADGEPLPAHVDGADPRIRPQVEATLEDAGLLEAVVTGDRRQAIRRPTSLGWAVKDALWRGEVDRWLVVCPGRHPRQLDDPDDYDGRRHCPWCRGIGYRGDLDPAPDPTGPSTPVGMVEVAAKLGVRRQTVDMWHHRDLLPEPDWTVGGRPAWRWSTIETWARETGRLDT